MRIFAVIAAAKMLVFAFVITASAQEASEAQDGFEQGSFLQILTYKKGDLLNQGSGVAIVNGQIVLTSAHLLERSDEIQVLDLKGRRHVASLLRSNAEEDLALLSVKGLNTRPLLLSGDSLEVSQSLDIQGFWDPDGEEPRRQGLFGGKRPKFQAVVQPALSSAVGIVQSHDETKAMVLASFGRGGYGAPLLNDCNAIVGLVRRNDSGDLSSVWRLHAIGPQVRAAPQAALQRLIEAAGLEPDIAPESCLGKVDGAEAEAERSRRAEAERKAAEEEKKRKDAEEDVERAQAETDQARRDAAEVTDSLAKAAEEAKREADKKEQEKERLRSIIFGSIGLLIFFIGLAFYIFVKRRKDLTKANETIEQATARFNDCVFEGSNSDGAPAALRISGGELRQAPGGVTIGRNPDQSQFVLGDDTVSRRHAVLRIQGENVTLEDLDSTSGTKVNGSFLSPHQSIILTSGDVVEFGAVRMTFTIMVE